MPMFEFDCQSCGNHFKKIMRLKGNSKISCPSCSSEKVQKHLPSFSTATTESNLEQIEKRIQKTYDEIKKEYREHRKEIGEKDWTK